MTVEEVSTFCQAEREMMLRFVLHQTSDVNQVELGRLAFPPTDSPYPLALTHQLVALYRRCFGDSDCCCYVVAQTLLFTRVPLMSDDRQCPVFRDLDCVSQSLHYILCQLPARALHRKPGMVTVNGYVKFLCPVYHHGQIQKFGFVPSLRVLTAFMSRYDLYFPTRAKETFSLLLCLLVSVKFLGGNLYPDGVRWGGGQWKPSLLSDGYACYRQIFVFVTALFVTLENFLLHDIANTL